MSKIIIPILLALSLSAQAQTWGQVSGRWQYQFMKIDSAVYLPGGPTSTRKAPVAGNYWVRFNTDSSGFEFSDGVKWTTFSLRPPRDLVVDIPGRDTSITITCGIAPGTYASVYAHVNLPQYIGFRLRVYFSSFLLDELDGFCVSSSYFSGPIYYYFNSNTGDLFVIGGMDYNHNIIQISAY
ncbi:MAG TPA: hypothetical protein VG605_16730 [Puia sp.]|nr:hypothetical protein [Puia sp.]